VNEQLLNAKEQAFSYEYIMARRSCVKEQAFSYGYIMARPETSIIGFGQVKIMKEFV
jgi:hypothetical protein